MQINSKKWLIIIGMFALTIAILIIIMYNNAQKPYEEAKQTAVRQIQEKAELTGIDHVYVYYSAASYYAVTGKNKSGEPVAVWLNKDNQDQLTVLPLSSGITEQKARKLFAQETGNKEVLSLTLGMENQIPVWVFTFKNESGKLNYYYLTFKDGKWWKKVENI